MKKFAKIISSPNMKAAAIRNMEVLPKYQYQSVVIDEDIKVLLKGKKYFIRTYGCQGNLRDSEVISGILERIGYVVTDSVNDADIILLNTCCVRENAEKKVFGEIGTLKSLKQKRPDLIIGVCGCMVQQEHIVSTILSKYQQVDILFGTHNIHELPEILDKVIETKSQQISVYSKEGDIIENIEDVTHRTFKNLFVNSEYDESHKSVIMCRRNNNKKVSQYLVNRLFIEDENHEISYETERASFIGRNRNTNNPIALTKNKLSNHVGTNIDPVISLRSTIAVPKGEERVVYYINALKRESCGV